LNIQKDDKAEINLILREEL